MGDVIIFGIWIAVSCYAYYFGHMHGKSDGLSTAMIKQECSELKDRFEYDDCVKKVNEKVEEMLK